VSLTSQLKIVDSPIGGYFRDNYKVSEKVKAEWKRQISGADTIPTPSVNGRSLAGECGLAIGHLLAGKVTGHLGWGSGGKPFVGLHPSVDAQLHNTLTQPIRNIDQVGAVCASWWAGLFDRLGRGISRLDDPFLSPLLSATDLEEANEAIPNGVIQDLILMADACSELLETLPRPMKSGVVPSGARCVGGADADLVGSRVVVEIKATKSGNTLARETIWQLIGYPLLDFDNIWETETVVVLLARQGRAIRWPLQLLLSDITGRPVDVQTERDQLATLFASQSVSRSRV
jgi:hypothetical protein